jgi:hypothetical protein
MSINLNFCNCLGSLHQLAPIVKDVSKMVLDGVCLPDMRSMALKANLAQEGPLPQTVELCSLIEMKLHMIKVDAEVVMRPYLTCFRYIFCFPFLCAHSDDWLLFFINFDFNFLFAGLYHTGSLRVILLYLYLLNIYWWCLNIDFCVLAKSIFLRFHLFE